MTILTKTSGNQTKSIQDVDFKTEKVYEDSLSSTRKIIEPNDLILIIFIVDCLNPKVTCDLLYNHSSEGSPGNECGRL